MSDRDATVDYRDIQARKDAEYLDAWRVFLRDASYSDRLKLRSLGMVAPVIDPKVDPRRRASAEEMERVDRLRAAAERSEITPADILQAKEDAEGISPETEALDLSVDVQVHYFHLFASFLGAGVDELDLLKYRSAIMLRAVAPILLEKFGFPTQRAALKEEARLRSSFSHRLARDYVPLSELLDGPAAEGEEWLAGRDGKTTRVLRTEFFASECMGIGRLCSSLEQFAKNLAAHLRRKKPLEIRGLGETQTEVSRKFGEQRATVSAREIRVVEEPARAAGVRGFHFLGGTKTDSHRRACAKAQRGNTHRRTATEFRREAIARDEAQTSAA